jgi:GNAT superfamily N-acetyltransferase
MSDHSAVTRAQRVTQESAKAFSAAINVGRATVLRVPAAPDSPMVNRIVGLGLGQPATEADLDRAVAAIEPGVTFYVAVAPDAQPPALSDWLRARGFEPGWGWMAFHRGVTDPPPVETTLRIVPVAAAEQAALFGRIVRAGFGLPPAVEPALARAVNAGWRCFLALDGDEPAAAAGLYAAEGVAYLGFAATLPEHRGKGAQSALLATRIRHAAGLGCDLVVTETGERRDDRPSSSYRNILRAGFTEQAVTANWLGRR